MNSAPTFTFQRVRFFVIILYSMFRVIYDPKSMTRYFEKSKRCSVPDRRYLQAAGTHQCSQPPPHLRRARDPSPPTSSPHLPPRSWPF